MSESTTTVESTEVQSDSVDYSGPFGEFLRTSVETMTPQILEANKIADRVKHADNAFKAVYEVRDDESTEDPNVKAYQEYVDARNEEILAAQKDIEEYIVNNGLVDTTPVDVEGETASFKQHKTQIEAMRKALATIPGGEQALNALPELAKLAGTRSSTTGATGVKRPRLSEITVDGRSIEKDGKTNMTLVSQYLEGTKPEDDENDYSGEALRNHMYAEAGTDDLKSLKGRPIEFAVGTHQIVAVPSV